MSKVIRLNARDAFKAYSEETKETYSVYDEHIFYEGYCRGAKDMRDTTLKIVLEEGGKAVEGLDRVSVFCLGFISGLVSGFIYYMGVI